MLTVRLMWWVLASVWVGSEIALTRKSLRHADGAQHDRGSAGLLWAACAVGLVAALLFKHWQLAPFAFAYGPRQAAAVLLFALGIGLRFLAIRQLGEQFNSRIVINRQHQLVEKGLYRWVRHPSYTGLLLALAAAGLAMGDGLALLALVVPPMWAVLHRIELEEALLTRYFYDEYPAYCKQTKKLLPWVY